MVPLCSVIGVGIAFGVVMGWFPHTSMIWQYPLQQIDAPAHYYFVRRILGEGLGSATHLWPNDAYYPPLFHLLAAGLVKVASVLGADMPVYAAVNIVWLVTSGIVWPAGVLILSTYWTRLVDSRLFSGAMAIIVPVLSVSSASHPFLMLARGPLFAYGLATSLLPYWLYATLRLCDALIDRWRRHADDNTGQPAAAQPRIWPWIVGFIAIGGLCVFAHPRIVFSWLLLMAPFIVLRMPWKVIAALAGAVVCGAVALFVYMRASYQSNRYSNPASWFHTFVPSCSVPEALRTFITDNISGPAGWLMAVVTVLALVVIGFVIARPRTVFRHDDGEDGGYRNTRKDAISLVVAWLLLMLLFVCSTSLTGWFPNIVAAAWYRADTRPLSMIPFGVIPLLVFAACAAASADASVLIPTPWNGGVRTEQGIRLTRAVLQRIVIVVLVALAIVCQFGNTERAALSQSVYRNVQLTDDRPTEQLTSRKYQALGEVVRVTGTRGVIISDPLNGSMYAVSLYGANMLYPIYNPMKEKNGAKFEQTELAFASGDDARLLNTVCPLGGNDTPTYFLAMGPQAPSLQMFTFRQQFDPFHDEGLVAQYERHGTLVKVRDLSRYGKGWALYRFGCAE
ncbi:DUF6541 family protein [Bifidobacterium apri]|uniref:DUF6541 family protein n=1 Tax=Bifidobacterium apri TaxID=1769423 RepID=UPI003995050E